MSLKEQIDGQLEQLTAAELEQVADYLRFLRLHPAPVSAQEESRLIALYAEAGTEDRELAEAGAADYAAGLIKEDSR